MLSNLPELKRNSSFGVFNQFWRKTRLSTSCPLTNCRGSIRYFQLIKSAFGTSNLQFNGVRFNAHSYDPSFMDEKFSMKNGGKRNVIVLLQSTKLFKFSCGKYIFLVSRRIQKHSLVWSSVALINPKKNCTCNKRKYY